MKIRILFKRTSAGYERYLKPREEQDIDVESIPRVGDQIHFHGPENKTWMFKVENVVHDFTVDSLMKPYIGTTIVLNEGLFVS